jgi:hypothetical protein
MKLSIISLGFLLTSAVAVERTSETLDARKGQFRLLSAELVEKGSYHFTTSMEFFQQDDLVKDSDNSRVRDTKANLAFGYALTPQILLSGHGGFNIAARTPQAASGSTTTGSDAIDLIRGGIAVTGFYDLGKWFHLLDKKFVAGLSVWVDFSKITRFIEAPNIIPTAIFSGDFTDNVIAPVRTHLNLGFRPANGKRFYDDSTIPKDYDRFVTDTLNSWAWTTGVGLEFPFENINPSAEFHLVKTQDTAFGQAPKWVTVGVKGKPLGTKNIELFGAVDIGLTSFKATVAGQKPDSPVVPLWNAVVGFSVNEFGIRHGETTVSEAEYRRLKTTVNEQDSLLQSLKRELEYVTVQGRVIDASTKAPLSGVTLSFPESPDLKTSRTDSEGRFVRYFRSLTGTRLVVALEGYDSSSKFLSLKPGERVTSDIELKRASPGQQLTDFVATITNDAGAGVVSTVTLKNVQTQESTVGSSDNLGQIVLKVAEGSYELEISARGMNPIKETIEFQKGKTVLRSYVLIPEASPSPTPTEP